MHHKKTIAAMLAGNMAGQPPAYKLLFGMNPQGCAEALKIWKNM